MLSNPRGQTSDTHLHFILSGGPTLLPSSRHASGRPILPTEKAGKGYTARSSDWYTGTAILSSTSQLRHRKTALSVPSQDGINSHTELGTGQSAYEGTVAQTDAGGPVLKYLCWLQPDDMATAGLQAWYMDASQADQREPHRFVKARLFTDPGSRWEIL